MDMALPPPDVVDQEVETTVLPGSKTQLPNSVQTLLKLIFDFDAMQRVMLEMDIDLEKMPLGQISKTQLRQAYEILGNVLKSLDEKNNLKSNLVNLTNQFYTLVDFMKTL
jgi:hypothetical protein